MKVAEIMTKNVLTVNEDADFTEACRLMQQMKIHHLPVVDKEGQLKGIFTANDALKAYNEKVFNRVITEEDTVNELIKISQIMSQKEIYSLDLESELDYALTLMKEFDIHSIPVLDEGKIIGIVTSTDILNVCDVKSE